MDAIRDSSFQRPSSVLHAIGTFLQIGIVRARVFFGPGGRRKPVPGVEPGITRHVLGYITAHILVIVSVRVCSGP